MKPHEAYDRALQSMSVHHRAIGVAEWQRRKQELELCGRMLNKLTALFDDFKGDVASPNEDLDGSETAQLLRIMCAQTDARHRELVLLTNGAEYVHWMRVCAGIEVAAV